MCKDPEVGNERRLVDLNFCRLAGRLIQMRLGQEPDHVGFHKSLQGLVWILLSHPRGDFEWMDRPV